jgi:hypothetical protein
MTFFANARDFQINGGDFVINNNAPTGAGVLTPP